jgi:hypothetical protein
MPPNSGTFLDPSLTRGRSHDTAKLSANADVNRLAKGVLHWHDNQVYTISQDGPKRCRVELSAQQSADSKKRQLQEDKEDVCRTLVRRLVKKISSTGPVPADNADLSLQFDEATRQQLIRTACARYKVKVPNPPLVLKTITDLSRYLASAPSNQEAEPAGRACVSP